MSRSKRINDLPTASYSIWDGRGQRVTATGDVIDAKPRKQESAEQFEERLRWGRLDELAIDWRDEIQRTGKTSTVNTYRTSLNKWILPYMGNLWLTDCNLAAFKAWAVKVAKVDGDVGRLKAANTALGSMVSWAAANGRWPESVPPFGGLDLRRAVLKSVKGSGRPANKRRKSQKLRTGDVPTIQQTIEYGKLVEKEAVRVYGPDAAGIGALPVVQYVTGTRIAEAVILTVDSFDLDNLIVRIDAQTDRSAAWSNDDMEQTTTKSESGVREAALWEAAIPLLQPILDAATTNPSGLLFPAQKVSGKQVTNWLVALEARLRDVRRSGKIYYPFTSHFHRHAYATWNLAPQSDAGYGCNVADVSDWLGDTIATVQDTYWHPTGATLKGRSAHLPGTG